MMEAAKDSLDLGVLVSDIQTSLHFYRDLLGLTFIEERPLWFGRMYRLRFGNSDFKLIVPQANVPKGPTGLESQLGFRYVTFVVKHLSDLCNELKNKGVEFTVPLRELRPGVWIAMVKDPDGNIVEFVERV